MKKFLTLPLSYEQTSFSDDRFVKVRIKVMHNGLNLNNSSFGDVAIEKARPTLANIPLLAFVKKTDGEEDDLAGHEFEFRITENELKYVYLGRPIGMIPESNNYEYGEDEDGKKFVLADGYIWSDYANEALDIIQRDNGKNVSMEIRVNSYNDMESYVDITDFKYTGIAFLGEDVSPAMVGARADLAEFSFEGVGQFVANFTAELQKSIEESKQVEPETFEEPIVEPETEPDTPPTLEPQADPIVEPVVEPEVPVVEPEVPVEPEAEPDIPVEPETPEKTVEEQLAEVQAEMESIKAALEETKNSLHSVTTERDELLSYKQGLEKAQFTASLEGILKDFSDLEEDEISEVITSNTDLSDIELRLFALRGKKNTKAPANHIQTYSIYDSLVQKQKLDVPAWAELVEKHYPKSPEGGN